MERLVGGRWTPVWAVLLFYLGYLFLLLGQVGFNPTVLADIGNKNALYSPETFGPSTLVWRGSFGYDGQMYLQMALHPFDLPAYFDSLEGTDLPFRYQRILQPFLSYLLAGGQPVLVPWAMIVLSLAALLGIAMLARSFLVEWGRSAWWVPAVGVSISPLVAFRYDMPQVGALFFGLLAFWLYTRGYRAGSVGAVAAGSLTWEGSLLFLGPILWQELGALRWRAGAVMLLGALLPFILWQVVLRSVFGFAPSTMSAGNLAPPLASLSQLVGRTIEEGGLRALGNSLSNLSLAPFLNFSSGVVLGHILTIVFYLFLLLFFLVGTLSGVRWAEKGLFYKLLLFQGLFVLVAGSQILDDLFSTMRVLGPLLITFVFVAAEQGSRWIKVGAGGQLAWSLLFLMPFPNVLHTYHEFFLLP